jgi:hypothetical protein
MSGAETVKCVPCDQVLTKARHPAHLASKKHADAVAKHNAATALATIDSAVDAIEKAIEDGEDPTEALSAALETATTSAKAATAKSAETKPATAKSADAKAATAKATETKPATAKTASSLLAIDPDTPGHFWCGICAVSLGPARSDAHLDTQRHADAVAKLVATAMKTPKPTV